MTIVCNLGDEAASKIARHMAAGGYKSPEAVVDAALEALDAAADRRQAPQPRNRRVHLAAELPDDVLAEVKKARMDPRHDHLNALLDDEG